MTRLERAYNRLSSRDEMYAMNQDSAKTNILLLICAINGCSYRDVMDGDCASTLSSALQLPL